MQFLHDDRYVELGVCFSLHLPVVNWAQNRSIVVTLVVLKMMMTMMPYGYVCIRKCTVWIRRRSEIAMQSECETRDFFLLLLIHASLVSSPLTSLGSVFCLISCHFSVLRGASVLRVLRGTLAPESHVLCKKTRWDTGSYDCYMPSQLEHVILQSYPLPQKN